ncbi:hypothetical protein LT679_11485 [Mucilaginibacter roseus]|uniref:DUF922 domain-containing protein n=1 Tax=Mucilaginibacter roseus TaxID=1528868 RepID=A0ABS8U6J6_9SPHI|nr:hypothetical protein [Mucilaginibacter roseus]MCD8741226.1 hypothetical protein [Mucilaginibacter roseus]
MKYIYVFFLILLFKTSSVLSQEIKWQKDSLLTWNNFRGPIEPNRGVSAVVYCGMKYSYRYYPSVKDSGYTAKFEVYSYVDPTKSWSMKERECPPLLNHEQGHFNICEYFARQLKLALESARYTKKVNEEVKAIYDKYELQLNKMHHVYDTQANHGADVHIQAKWNTFIAALLSNNPSLEETLKAVNSVNADANYYQ